MTSTEVSMAESNDNPANYINILLKELETFKANFAAVTEENKQLRAQINALHHEKFPQSELSRKVYNKKFKQNPPGSSGSSTGANTNATDTYSVEQVDAVHNASCSLNDNGFTLVTKKNVNKKRIIQAIHTNIKDVKKYIKEANCNEFSVKQSNAKAPIKISINKPDEILIIRAALQRAKVSFHEYKWNSEKNKCYLIRGLVGATHDDLPYYLEELVRVGIPAEATLSLHVTGHMKSNTEKVHNTLVKMVVPPNFDNNVLKAIKYIDHVAVKFENFKSKTIVQR